MTISSQPEINKGNNPEAALGNEAYSKDVSK